MIFALTFIQVFGSLMAQLLGMRTGALLTGFFGGLVSSTATTASLARKNNTESGAGDSRDMLTFLAATSAMLFEGIALVLIGTTDIHMSVLLIFLGPVFATAIMIYMQSKKLTDRRLHSENISFRILPILRLSLFIIAVLLLSKLLQNIFGKSGLMVLTFLVSLFEIHGSIIANVQLHDGGTITANFLGVLLTISIVASCLSKLFLIVTLGSPHLRVQASRSTFILFLSLLVSWLISSVI